MQEHQAVVGEVASLRALAESKEQFVLEAQHALETGPTERIPTLIQSLIVVNAFNLL